jgi:hypothetical protein
MVRYHFNHDGYQRDGYYTDGYNNWIEIDTDLEGNFNSLSHIMIHHKSNPRFHVYITKSALINALALFNAQEEK